MKGYVVDFEGDGQSGCSAHSPDLPGVVAAGETLQETEVLMREAMVQDVAYLHETGQSVPEPIKNAQVAILDVPAA
jgi:predicted RNase H-like HicB family nuclease